MNPHETINNRYHLVEPVRTAKPFVWKASDIGLGTAGVPIAIKFFPPDRFDPTSFRRFEYEVATLERLDHPCIPKYLGHGTIDGEGSDAGTPFVVMEYLEGFRAAEEIGERSELNQQDAARIVRDVADALRHLHESGLVHRDVSGRNILVRNDETGFTVKLIDFEFVRETERLRNATISSFRPVGTLLYMSPESTHPNPAGVTAKSDVWSLGVVLFHLLTRAFPFFDQISDGKNFNRMAYLIGKSHPQNVVQLCPACPKSLAEIVGRCLEKNPLRRFTAAELVTHLDGFFIDGEHYRVPSIPASQRLKAWISEHSRAVTSLVATAISLAVLVPLILFQLIQLQYESHGKIQARINEASANARAEQEQDARIEQERLAQERDLTARRNAYVTALKLAHDALDVGDIAQVLRLLDEQRPPSGKEDLRGFEWYWLWHMCHREWHLLGEHPAPIACVAWSAVENTIASGSADGSIRLWDGKSRQLVGELHGHNGRPVLALAFLKDGEILATAGHDGTACLWDVPRRQLSTTFSTPDNHPIGAIALSPDGRTLVVGIQDDSVAPQLVIWDIDTREQTVVGGQRSSVQCLAFSPDGNQLAVGTGPCVTYDGPCDLLLYSAGSDGRKHTLDPQPRQLRGHQGAIWSVTFSSDGETLISGSRDQTIRFWNVHDGRERQRLLSAGPGEPRVTSVSMAPNDQRLVSVGLDATVRIWDPKSGIERRIMRGHRDTVRSVAFSPDSQTVVTGSDDGTLRLWDADKAPPRDVIRLHEFEIMSLAVSPDGQTLATGSGVLGKKGELKLTSFPEGNVRTLQEKEARLMGVTFSEDGELLATAGGDWNQPGRVDLWDMSTERKRATYFLIDDATPEEKREEPKYFRAATGVSFSPGGRYVAAGGGIWGVESRPGLVRVWEIENGATKAILRGHTALVRSVAFSPREGRLATGGYDAVVRLWDTSEWREIGTIKIDPPQVIMAINYSHDGSLLAVAVSTPLVIKPSRVIVFDTTTLREVTTLDGHRGFLFGVAFTADSKRLATAAYDHTARIWDAETGQELARFALTSGGTSAAFSANGKILAVGIQDGTVRLWDIGEATKTHP